MKFFFLLINIIAFSYAATAQRSLDYYIQSALQSSPLLKDYQNQIRANGIDSMRIRAQYKTQVNGNSTNYYAPVIGGWGYDNAITNGTNFSQLIGANQKLVSKQNIQNQYEAIRLQNQSLDISGKISEQDLKKSITTQYITAYGSWQQFNYNNEMLALLKNEENILKQLAQKGVYRQTDYLTFLVTVQQQEIQIKQIHLQYQNEFAMLNYLSGINDTSFTALTMPALDSSIVAGLDGSIFYKQFENDSLKLRNSDAQIDFLYKPKVTVYADAGYLSSFAFMAYKNFGASVGVNITVPIYDGHQKKMQHDKIAIAEDTRKQYSNFFRTQHDQQIAQLQQQLQSTQQLIDETTNQLRFSQGLIDANRKLLQTGDARIADYIIAIGNYLAAKNVIIINTISKMQIINQLNYWNRK